MFANFHGVNIPPWLISSHKHEVNQLIENSFEFQIIEIPLKAEQSDLVSWYSWLQTSLLTTSHPTLL